MSVLGEKGAALQSLCVLIAFSPTVPYFSNIWIDEGRKKTRSLQTFVSEEAGIAIGSEGAQEAAVELGNVDRAMQSLPPDQREAVLLVMVEGYAYKEAAEIVGCPVGTLNSRLVRGRDALMAELGEAS